MRLRRLRRGSTSQSPQHRRIPSSRSSQPPPIPFAYSPNRLPSTAVQALSDDPFSLTQTQTSRDQARVSASPAVRTGSPASLQSAESEISQPTLPSRRRRGVEALELPLSRRQLGQCLRRQRERIEREQAEREQAEREQAEHEQAEHTQAEDMPVEHERDAVNGRETSIPPTPLATQQTIERPAPARRMRQERRRHGQVVASDSGRSSVPFPRHDSEVTNNSQSNAIGRRTATASQPRRQRRDALPAGRRPYVEPVIPFSLGSMDAQCLHCGAFHWLEERVGGNRTRPEFGRCCFHGIVRLEPIPDPPPRLRALLIGDDEQSREFRLHIRQYNCALAFTSFSANEQNINTGGGGPWIWKAGFQLYHSAGSLQPMEGQQPRYAQLYFYDPQDALMIRMQRNQNLREDTMRLLQQLMFECNRYTRIYKQAYEILEQNEAEDISIHLIADPSTDPRRYNLPTADEIAVIIPGDENQVTDPRDIVLRRRSGVLQCISDLHSAYAPLHYVLLFPWGTPGWTDTLRLHLDSNHGSQRTHTRLTQLHFYSYRIHTRDGQFPTLHLGGRLFQQYLCDMWVSTEQNRLRWVEANQPKLRAALYSGLEDAVAQTDDNLDLHEVGRRIVLPSSHVGSPRYMHQLFQDAMAVARFYHKVDLFITVTCNPNWDEIVRELLPGQTAADRPDLVARVFAMYKKAIIDDLYKKGIFGRAVAHIHCIEFQKRGLPHMHLLLILHESSRLTTPAEVDSVVHAHWPDPDREPRLFEIVKRCMVHGPCGAANPNAPCMREGKCSKGFPKAFQQETVMTSDGYPIYARPDDGRTYEVRGSLVDNRWIVPYNPYLSSKYNAHINVECVISLAAAKYITKYTHKGPDCATIQIRRRDEVAEFKEGRYIAGSEAAWHILGFPIHQQVPNFVHLQVHLPGRHMVVFDPDEPLEVVMARAAQERTMLKAFFETNRNDMNARQYTYQEFPQHYTWNQELKKWSVRQQRFALGRMYFVRPTEGERFYLRTLLTVVKGATGWDDLRSYNGITYPTFRDACLARGLLEHDDEWRQCLLEASAMRTGDSLRRLFSVILEHCEPSQPGVLWDEFRIPDPSERDVYDFGLFLLDRILLEHGRSLSSFTSMPQPEKDWGIYDDNPFLSEQLRYNVDHEKRLAEEQIPLLNADQRNAFDKVFTSVHNEHGKMFFVHGPGGTGKTFLYQTLCHRPFFCPGDAPHTRLSRFQSKAYHTIHGAISIRTLSVRICCDRYGPEAVDRTLRDIRGNQQPFGGITVVFGGDFQQTLPVVVRGTREEIVLVTLQRSNLWQDVEVLHLHQNMRLEHDASTDTFARWLLDVGHGRVPALPNCPENVPNAIALPEHMICTSQDNLINSIYTGISDGPVPPPDFFLNRVILAPRNDEVHTLNHEIITHFPGEESLYTSADSFVQEAGADGEQLNLPIEFLHSLNSSGLPLAHLRLKLGCPLLLLRNLSPRRGLCNGSRVTLLRMSNRVLEVRLMGGEHDGEIAFIPRITLSPSDNNVDFAIKLKRRQFPVQLAFAMTINKSQGQSVKYVGIDLQTPVFSHGQLYVALSRATSSQRIKILLPEESSIVGTPNVVYPEALISRSSSASDRVPALDHIADASPLSSNIVETCRKFKNTTAHKYVEAARTSRRLDRQDIKPATAAALSPSAALSFHISLFTMPEVGYAEVHCLAVLESPSTPDAKKPKSLAFDALLHGQGQENSTILTRLHFYNGGDYTFDPDGTGGLLTARLAPFDKDVEKPSTTFEVGEYHHMGDALSFTPIPDVSIEPTVHHSRFTLSGVVDTIQQQPPEAPSFTLNIPQYLATDGGTR
ncbi:hypothetical protein EVG20_g9444 [Dentipellis fragilis]|uniref:ATP-dependent DNA helicase n=1 Tax=Dentipellis fragilis TaxID=205917 RepID=A0A4Y9Y051_9AGAM|nr:hypothetical protein EVG20_g9444 [Dentipellis fragilis]